MGQWFANFLLNDGKEVVITGRNEKKLLQAKQQLGVEIATNAEAVRVADVILISVPINNFELIIKEIRPYINPKQIVADITSIKVLPVEIMHKYLKIGLTIGVHPMFGPGAKSIADQNFILTPTNKKETVLAQKIREYLETKRAKVTLMTPREHDEMMAIILGLTHFIAIVSADTLLSLDQFGQTEAVSGTTYKLLLTLVESVISENADLYATLQMSLPNMVAIEDTFQKSAKTWAALVKNKDQEQFTQNMQALRQGFEQSNPSFGRAYQNMYKIIEGLQRTISKCN
jgi:prephenate dehydrogenase